MKIFQDLSIRIQLTVILIVVGIIPMIMVGYTANQTAALSVQELAEESLKNTVRSLSMNLNHILTQGKSMGINVQSNPILLESIHRHFHTPSSLRDENYIRDYLIRFLGIHRSFSFAAIVHSSGNHLYASTSGSDIPQHLKEEFFSLNIPTQGQWLKNLGNQKEMIFMLRPITFDFPEDSTVLFVLGMDENQLNNHYSEVVPSSHRVFLFDKEGIIFSSQNPSEKGSPLPGAFGEMPLTSSGTLLEEDYFYSWSRFYEDWSVGLSVPKSIWLLSIENQGRSVFYFILFAILITLFMAFSFSFQFSKPLLSLQKKMFYASFGTYDLRVPVINKNEMGILAESFNRLMEYLEKEKTLRLEAEANLSRLNQRLDRRVKERTRDLEKSMEDLTMAQERLIQTEKMAALGGLVAGVAHEINTPLGTSTTATSYLQTIVNKLKEKYQSNEMTKSDLDKFLEDSTDSLEIIRYNLTRSSEIVRDFKNVAVEKALEDFFTIELFGFLHEVIQSIGPRFEDSKPEFELFIDPNLKIRTDPKQLHQVFSNLFLNAWIHGFEQSAGGKITLRAGQKLGSTWIQIQDNGKGMRKDEKLKAFNPFYTTKRGAGGTGLGLHIVYNIVVSSLRGQIELESEEGKGSIFTITLPDLD